MTEIVIANRGRRMTRPTLPVYAVTPAGDVREIGTARSLTGARRVATEAGYRVARAGVACDGAAYFVGVAGRTRVGPIPIAPRLSRRRAYHLRVPLSDAERARIEAWAARTGEPVATVARALLLREAGA